MFGSKGETWARKIRTLDPDLRHDIDLTFGTVDDLAEYGEHDSGDDAGSSRCEGAEEGEKGDGESRPARVNTERGEED